MRIVSKKRLHSWFPPSEIRCEIRQQGESVWYACSHPGLLGALVYALSDRVHYGHKFRSLKRVDGRWVVTVLLKMPEIVPPRCPHGTEQISVVHLCDECEV